MFFPLVLVCIFSYIYSLSFSFFVTAISLYLFVSLYEEEKIMNGKLYSEGKCEIKNDVQTKERLKFNTSYFISFYLVGVAFLLLTFSSFTLAITRHF